jgi:hypothetical protein
MSIKCQEVDSLSDDFFEGRLDSRQLREIHRHLSECEDCLQHFVAYQWVLLILRQERYYFRHVNPWNQA